jgi:hypothetical protein
VLRAGGEEAWLAGALVFTEDDPTAALFVAPDAGKDRAIFTRPKPAPLVWWLLPIGPAELAIGPEPPTSLEHEGVRFERVRRLPLRAERQGTGAPDVGDNVIVAEYTGPGAERLVVVAGSGSVRAWRGSALEEGMFDVLPSGRSTLG